MERLIFANKKTIALFVTLFITGIIMAMIPVRGWKPHNMPALCYITIIIMWAHIIHRRILNAQVRNRILIACVFMVLLFFFRMCKYSYFPDIYIVEEMLWYLYYIPMTAIPLFFFLAALYADPVRRPGLVRVIERILIVAGIIISVTVLTNPLHSQVFRVTVHPGKEYTHAWFYFVILAWMIICGIGTFYVLFLKCSLTAARKLWYIPAICIVAGCVLLAWYLINGGAPKLGGIKLFQLHEAYCLPFISAVESMILIGIIPANSGYGQLFDHSAISACIYDKDGNPVLASGDWQEVPTEAVTGPATEQTATQTEPGRDADTPDRRIRREDVEAGYVIWIEDLSAISRLNAEIAELTEELEDENDLIRQENDIRAERVSYETKNRLYNRIAAAVRGRAINVNELLKDKSGDEEEFHGDLIYALVQTAYIKRMGNLMLVTDGVNRLSTGELRLAIGESMDYIRMSGCVCDLQADKECEISSDTMLLAYELFECAVEDVWSRLNSLSVVFDVRDRFSMTIALDRKAEAISPGWKDREIRRAHCSLSVNYEDETYYIRLEETV